MPLGEKSVRNKIKSLSISYPYHQELREILMEFLDRIEALEEKIDNICDGVFKEV